MPVLPIVRLGHPALRSRALPLEPAQIGEPATSLLIDDMIETMRAVHGVGLAATQLGVGLQIFVYEVAPPAERTSASAADPARPDDLADPADLAGRQPPGDKAPAGGDPSVSPIRPIEQEALLQQVRPARLRRLGEARATAEGPIPLRVVINPMITLEAGEQVYDWEGCLSIPDLRGLVPRHPAVRVRGLDREGLALDYAASGLEARIIQHEFDHLNGIVFLDRMRDLKTLAFSEEWEHFLVPVAGETEEPPVG